MNKAAQIIYTTLLLALIACPLNTQALYSNTPENNLDFTGTRISNSLTSNVSTSIGQNYPNPFHSVTTIEHSLSGDFESAYIDIMDFSGRRAKRIPVKGKKGKTYVTSTDLSGQFYYYTLVVDEAIVGSKKMLHVE